MRLLESWRLSYVVDLLFILSLITIGGLVWFIFFSEKSPLASMIALQHAINQQERFLLRKVDHRALAQELRDIADREEWKDVDFNKDDSRLPAYVRSLKPSAVYIRGNDHVIINFGGPFEAMDIRAFKPGIEGMAPKSWATACGFMRAAEVAPRNNLKFRVCALDIPSNKFGRAN
jgi:hypothetical protein